MMSPLAVRGQYTEKKPLSPLNTWRVGGTAEHYFQPYDAKDLVQYLRALPEHEPVTWLGLGSNILVSDEGIRGSLIHTLKGLNQFNTCSLDITHPFDTLWRAEAGLTCAKLARETAKLGLVGGGFFAGIPGTVGGALAMNAGAWGGETWAHVVAVEMINRAGEITLKTPEAFEVGYRKVNLPEDEWFLAGYLGFNHGDVVTAKQQIKDLLRQRNERQPIGVLSCGSVFQNPTGYYAAELIEASKLKGVTIGDAQVSCKHANFIINRGKALASDIAALIRLVEETVLDDHKVRLKTEVRFLGMEK